MSSHKKFYRFLGIDYGVKRIGLSHGDTELLMATPLPMIANLGLKKTLTTLQSLLERCCYDGFVLGYPLNMDGSHGKKTQELDAFSVCLEKTFNLPVIHSDERLTSEEAQERLRENACVRFRTVRQQKCLRRSGRLDSGAAVLILQDYLNTLMPLLPMLREKEIDSDD